MSKGQREPSLGPTISSSKRETMSEVFFEYDQTQPKKCTWNIDRRSRMRCWDFFDFMMIMTIWWSKATQLLEFSRSRPQADPDLRTRFFLWRTEELGILVVGSKLGAKEREVSRRDEDKRRLLLLKGRRVMELAPLKKGCKPQSYASPRLRLVMDRCWSVEQI